MFVSVCLCLFSVIPSAAFPLTALYVHEEKYISSIHQSNKRELHYITVDFAATYSLLQKLRRKTDDAAIHFII